MAGAGAGDDVDIWCLGRGWEHRARQLRLEEDMDSAAAHGASMLLKKNSPEDLMSSILDMIYTNLTDFAGQQRLASNEGLLFSIVRVLPTPSSLLFVNSCFYIDGPHNVSMVQRLESIHYKMYQVRASA